MSVESVVLPGPCAISESQYLDLRLNDIMLRQVSNQSDDAGTSDYGTNSDSSPTHALSSLPLREFECGSGLACQHDEVFKDTHVAEISCEVMLDLKSDNLNQTNNDQGCPSTAYLIPIEVTIKKEQDFKMTAKGSEPIFNETQEFDYLTIEPLRRRCSSLRTTKITGSSSAPVLKKVVRFADVLGLDLESIRHIMNSDEPPLVPISAMRDLKLKDVDSGSQDSVTSFGSTADVGYLCFCFSQPGCSPDFVHRVAERKVLLETIAANDAARMLSGVVRVANMAYHKRVIVRYTLNRWLTHSDCEALYLDGSNDGPTDRFTFTLQLPDYFRVGCRLDFSVMYVAGGETYWDSNFGVNYGVECYTKSERKLDDDSLFSQTSNPFY